MATTVNAAIAGLIAQLQASLDLTDVQILDGPPTIKLQRAWVAVGYQPGKTEAVTVDYDWAQIGAQRSEEKYDLLCSLYTSPERSGDADIPALRTRAIAIRDAVAAAISTDRTLGGAVRLVHISSSVLHQEVTEQGYGTGFEFTVTCTARITT